MLWFCAWLIGMYAGVGGSTSANSCLIVAISGCQLVDSEGQHAH